MGRGVGMAAAVSGVAAAILLSAAGRRAPGPAGEASPPAPVAAASAAALPAPLPAVPVAAGPRNRQPGWGEEGGVSDDPLGSYIESSRYPPSSRPLGPHADDLLAPNRRHEEVRPSRDGRLRYRFSADRFFVVADEPLEAFLEVQGGRVDVTASFVAVLAPGRPFAELARVPFTLSAAGEGLYTAPIRPATLGLDRAAEVGVYVAFVHDGGEEKASFAFHYTPKEAVPARFTGQLRDGLAGGSLRIEAGVAVEKPGWYVIECNLYDRDGHPVAWTRFTGELAAGERFVPLDFFGKVLVDAGAPSPYRIGQLRGERHVLGREPDVDRMPDFTGRFETRAWALSDFSDAEWDDEARHRRIARLREAQAGPKGFATP